jgi:hypothetical protein
MSGILLNAKDFYWPKVSACLQALSSKHHRDELEGENIVRSLLATVAPLIC